MDLVKAMQDDARINLNELRVDGGAAANSLLMQYQADLLGVPVVRSRISETTALGAAYLAGLAVGLWKNQSEVAAHWRSDRVFEPAMPSERREQLVAGWRRALERAKAWEEAGPVLPAP